MTQIGKGSATSGCAIRNRVGDCIMPREGVFCGKSPKREPSVPATRSSQNCPIPNGLTAAVITLSDKGAKGEREDKSGPTAVKMLEEAGYEVVETMIIPDEPALLKAQLMRLADQRQVDLVLTSGGTGFSLRDQTPEATMAVADRNAPGISEYIRMRSAQITDRAMLSRGVSVIRKGTLIINLPGVPPQSCPRKPGVHSLHALDHGLRILRGSASECAGAVGETGDGSKSVNPI